jgi:hypothetical protein
LENDDGNAKEGDLLDFGEYVQGLENDTYVSSDSYYDDLLATISESAAENDSLSIDTDQGDLTICTPSELSGTTLCLSAISLTNLIDFEDAVACYEDNDDCVEDEDYYLDLINDYIADDPETYGLYALWRFGGSDVSGTDAYYAYYYVIEYQMTEEDSVIESFAYTGDGLFTFPDATPVLYWSVTAVAYYGDIENCPTSYDVYCVDYDATDGYTSGDGDLDADMAMFREYMSAGSSYYEIPSSASDLLTILDELGDYEEISQAVDPLRAAYYIKDYWGDYHQGDTVNYEEIQMALGYIENTKDVPLVTNDLLRYALAYMMFDEAFYNAIDTGTGVEADDIIDNDDFTSFINRFTDDVDDAISWYDSQDNDDKYNTLKNKYLALIMANTEVLDSIYSEDDGQFEIEDLEFYSEHESDYLSLMREAVQLITYNRAIFYRLDTGANVFNWQNYPNGEISIDNMLTGSEYIDFTPDGLISNLYQSLLLRAYEGDYSIDDDMQLNIGNILMAWDGNELLSSDPGNVFDEDAVDYLEEVLEIANLTALDADTSEWLEENLSTELDYWMPEGSVLRTTFATYMLDDLGYYSDGETEDLALELLEANDYDLEAAIEDMQEHLEPLQFFSEYEDRYDDLIEEVLLIMLDDFEGSVEVSAEVEAAVLEEALRYLPDSTIEADGEEAAQENIAAAYTAIRAMIWQSKNFSKILSNVDDLYDLFEDNGYFTKYTSTEWQSYYEKGYVHAARAASTAAVLVVKTMAAEGYDSEEFITTMSTTSYSIASDIVGSVNNYLSSSVDVADDTILKLNTLYNSLSDSSDMKAIVLKQAEYFTSIKTTTQSYATQVTKVVKIFALSDTIVSGYYTYVSFTSAEDAFDNGDYLLGTIYVIETAANGVATVSAAVEAAVLFGYMTTYASTAGVFGGASAAVAATISIALLAYEAHQVIAYEYSLAEFREEAEQVFRPDIVNDEDVTTWTESEVTEWNCVRFIENYNTCGWDEDDGSDDLDWIFTVDHPSEIADDGTVGS